MHFDDQYVHQQQIKGYFQELEILDKLFTFADGSGGIERLYKILAKIEPITVANLA